MGQFLVLDLDETLIANDFRFAYPTSNTKVYTLPSEYGFIDRFMLRPHVVEFLEWCSDNFSHIILATFSPTHRAERVTEVCGIREYFDLIIGRHVLEESMGHLLLGGEPNKSYDFGEDFCIVDDQPWNANHILVKMNFFGVDVRPVASARARKEDLCSFSDIEDRLIQAPPYEGDPEDNFFLRLLSSFKENSFSEDSARSVCSS